MRRTFEHARTLRGGGRLDLYRLEEEETEVRALLIPLNDPYKVPETPATSPVRPEWFYGGNQLMAEEDEYKVLVEDDGYKLY